MANGSFTIVPIPGTGSVTVNTTNITLDTTSKTEPGLEVQAIDGNLGLGITPGNAVTLSSATLPVPAGIGNSELVNFTLTVNGIVFSFVTGVTNARVASDTTNNVSGSFAEQFTGILSNGNGIFEDGTPAGLSESCTQSVAHGAAGLISCGNSMTISSLESPPGGVDVPEPSSLAILGASLIGFGWLQRRRISG